MIIQIKVTPNASKNQIVEWEGDVLRVRVKGVPEKGRVNEELIEFLAKVLGVAKSKIEIVSGRSGRMKKVRIEGIDEFPRLNI